MTECLTPCLVCILCQKDFSIDAEDLLFTILPLNLKQVFVMGQRVEIGFYDAKIINMAYCPGMNLLSTL